MDGLCSDLRVSAHIHARARRNTHPRHYWSLLREEVCGLGRKGAGEGDAFSLNCHWLLLNRMESQKPTIPRWKSPCIFSVTSLIIDSLFVLKHDWKTDFQYVCNLVLWPIKTPYARYYALSSSFIYSFLVVVASLAVLKKISISTSVILLSTRYCVHGPLNSFRSHAISLSPWIKLNKF
jgi:hypothetical protein